MKKTGLFLMLLMGGCYPPTLPPIIVPDYSFSTYVIGDSLCRVTVQGGSALSTAWPELLGLDHDCVSGRSIYDVFSVPAVDVIILALGWNGRTGHTEEEFRNAYEVALGRVSGDVLCLLPNVEREARVITELCANTLQSVESDYFDGTHYTRNAQHEMALLVKGWLDSY